MSRYHVSSSEGQYEKDSGEQVLANKLGIATSDEMDEAELVCKHPSFSSMHFLSVPVFQPSADTLPASGYSG